MKKKGKPGDVIFEGCWTPYCDSIAGICGFCGWDWSECGCMSSDWHCPCDRKQERFNWWNVFTVFWYDRILRNWWGFRGWLYGESFLSDWFYERYLRRET